MAAYDIVVGDACAVLETLAGESVQCVVTSPPYFQQRDYGVEGQYGLEATPDAYIAVLRTTFTQVHRVLKDDGSLWLNIGDGYPPQRRNTTGRPEKSLLGIPWRVAFALQDDGWLLRNAIVWHKPNAMPSSVRDRLRNTYELLFLLTKARRYYFDIDAIRQPYAKTWTPGRNGGRKQEAAPRVPGRRNHLGMSETAPHPAGATPGDVWTIATGHSASKHFASYPVELADRCIRAGSRAGDVVMDPFSGTGTTGVAALRAGRSYLGIELHPEHARTSDNRLAEVC